MVAAVVGAGVVGAGSQIIGSNNAASAQKDAANQANQTQQQFFNTANQNLQPFIQTGTGAASEIAKLEGLPTQGTAPTYDTQAYDNALASYNAGQNTNIGAPGTLPGGKGSLSGVTAAALGLPPAYMNNGGSSASAPQLSQFQTSAGTPGNPGGNSSDILSTLQGLPGYQFANTQGLKAVQNSASARGLGVSGAALKGAANFSTGEANQYYNNLLTGLQNTENTGAGAAGTLTGAATSAGSQIGQNTIGAGNAAAANSLSTGAAIGNVAGSVPNGLIASSLLQNSGNLGGIFAKSGAANGAMSDPQFSNYLNGINLNQSGTPYDQGF